MTYDGFGYSLAHPPEWTVNPDFPGPGVGFLASNAGIGLPPTQFSISIELLDAPIDLAEYGQNVRDDYAAIALNYQLLDEGAGEIDPIRPFTTNSSRRSWVSTRCTGSKSPRSGHC